MVPPQIFDRSNWAPMWPTNGLAANLPLTFFAVNAARISTQGSRGRGHCAILASPRRRITHSSRLGGRHEKKIEDCTYCGGCAGGGGSRGAVLDPRQSVSPHD